jgi:hypothetical protein
VTPAVRLPSRASVESALLSFAWVTPKMDGVNFFSEICRIFF